jgi:hypothetical protein
MKDFLMTAKSIKATLAERTPDDLSQRANTSEVVHTGERSFKVGNIRVS